MKRDLRISADPIDEASLVSARVLPPEMGAVVCFIGCVRGMEAGVLIKGLEYESFRQMAERQFELLFDTVEARWPVSSVRLVHRIGMVKASEASLWVEVIAPHRAEAFAACQWLVDEMKKVVPIWKKPRFAGQEQRPAGA